VSILTIFFWVLHLRIRPPRPTPWTMRERLYELASLPLLAVMTLICVAMPVLHSQTRLMRGIPLQFRVAANRYPGTETVNAIQSVEQNTLHALSFKRSARPRPPRPLE